MNDIFYKIGKVLLAGVILTAVINCIFGSEWLQYLPECYFHSATGFYCPGCGGTRAVMAILKFRIWESFLYHPFVIYVGSIYLIFMLQYSLSQREKYAAIKLIPMDKAMYIGIAIIIIQFFIKNLALLVQGSAWL